MNSSQPDNGYICIVSSLSKSEKRCLSSISKYVPDSNYCQINPALTAGVSYLAEADHFHDQERSYFIIFCEQFDLVDKIIKEMQCVEIKDECRLFGKWPACPKSFDGQITEFFQTRLMDNEVSLRLEFSSTAQKEGISIEYRLQPEFETAIRTAIKACCLLGLDGLSPIKDLKIRLIDFQFKSTDAFKFRAKFAVFKAVRGCFVNALRSAKLKPTDQPMLN